MYMLLVKKVFNIERQDRANVKRGGGLCCYIKDSIEYTRLSSNVNDCDAEIMSILLKRSHQKDILVVLVYRPPQGNVKTFIENLRNYIKNLRDPGAMNLVILGDFNIDYSRKSDGHTKSLKSLEREFLIEQKICEPTRVSKKKTLTLDLMFTDLKFVSFAKPLYLNMSDHFPTVMVYKKQRDSKNPTEITIRDMSESNVNDFKKALSEHDGSYIYKYNMDVNAIWDQLYSDVVLLLNNHCPLKTIRIRKDSPEYITDYIIEQMHKRDKLFKTVYKIGLRHESNGRL